VVCLTRDTSGDGWRSQQVRALGKSGQYSQCLRNTLSLPTTHLPLYGPVAAEVVVH
jgi:hypothetical protein